MRGGSAACAPLAILAPFCTLLARRWYIPLEHSNPAAFQNPSCSCIMTWCCEVGSGEGVGKVCSVGDPVATGCGCQHRRCGTPQPVHAFKPDQAWVLRGRKRCLMNQNWGQSKVWVGSDGPKCCITSASPERTAQRQSSPRPNPHRRCGAILYICRCVKLGLWGCVRELVCTVRALHSVFLTFPSTIFCSKSTIRTRKNHAIQRCAQVGIREGGSKVMPWGPYLATCA